MQQKEFFDRTGIVVTAEEYQEIEKMYMAAGEIDKEVFCQEYKKIENSKIVNALHQKVKDLKEQIKERDNIISNLHDQKKVMANFLIEQAEVCGSTDLRKKAISMIGRKEYLKEKIKKGLKLWEDDRIFLIGILSSDNQ